MAAAKIKFCAIAMDMGTVDNFKNILLGGLHENVYNIYSLSTQFLFVPLLILICPFTN